MPKVSTKPRPLANPEVCEIPKVVSKGVKKSPKELWSPVMAKVREAAGRTVKICVHPKARNVLATLRELFPEFGFTSRAIPLERGETFGVWAHLKPTGEDPPPPAGVPPADPKLNPPVG